MALIGMAVHSTPENKKDDCLYHTLYSLQKTVDFKKHRLILSVNAKTPHTDEIIEAFTEAGMISEVIYNETNLGTAEAINKVWAKGHPDENKIKMDDDIVIHHQDWIGLMEEAIRRNPLIGQIGLKRRDCMESPTTPGFYKSQLGMLSHKPGEKWITVEYANHVMGSCVMHSAALLKKVGYLWQPGLYGFDDSFMSLRSQLAGFVNCFLTAVDIEHIDDGQTPYQKWKEEKAGEKWTEYQKAHTEFSKGYRSLYYNPAETKGIKVTREKFEEYLKQNKLKRESDGGMGEQYRNEVGEIKARRFHGFAKSTYRIYENENWEKVNL